MDLHRFPPGILDCCTTAFLKRYNCLHLNIVVQHFAEFCIKKYVCLFQPFRLFWAWKHDGFHLIPHLSVNWDTGRNAGDRHWIPFLAAVSLRVRSL